MIENNLSTRRYWLNLIPYIVLAALFLIITIVIGLFIPFETSQLLLDELKQSIEPLKSVNPFSLLIIIFLNNAIKSLLVIVAGVFLGIPSILFVALNGITIGIVFAALKSSVDWTLIAAALVPHGIIEIPALIISTALGLALGIESLRYITRQPSSVKAHLQFGLKIYGQWIITGLLLASIIEVFITPLVVNIIGGGQSILIP